MIGAKANWSAAIEMRTLAALGVVSLKTFDPKRGSTLQYQLWSMGAK